MLLKFAWRNIWRNPRRTVITITAVTLGVLGIVLLHSYQRAAFGEMVLDLTRGLVGHLQVHGDGYQESPEIGNTVPDPAALETRLVSRLPGADVEKRVMGAAFAGAGEGSAAVLVMGVEPENAHVAALLAIDSGRLHDPGARREVVIGRGLARELEAEVGGELVLFGQAADGSLANDRYTIIGIGDGGSAEINATAVFMNVAEAQSFFSLGSGVHQMIVRLPEEEPDPYGAAALLRGEVEGEPLEVLAWGEILPELKGTIEVKIRQSHLIDMVVFLIVALGVLNTMTMSTFERTREFGVMAALGTRRGRVLGLVVVEALMQGIIGFMLGLLAAYLIIRGIGTIDMNAMAGQDMMGARFPASLTIRLHSGAVISAAVTTLSMMVAGGLIPAYRASKLKPADATRYV